LLILPLSNCQEEEVLNVENSVNNFNKEDARDFFNNNPIKIKQNLYFVGKLKWDNGNFNNDTLYVPLFSKGSVSIKGVKNGKTEKYIFPFIAVTENKSNQSFNYNLKVYFSLKKETINSETYHFYDNNNKLTVNKEKKVNKQALKTSKIAGCELWGYFLTNNETGERTLLYTWYECSSGGSNGTPEQEAPDGGGGGGEGGNCPEGYIQDQNGSCVPVTDAIIAQAIEDKIDDSKLDPCPKEVMLQLKNTTNADIANVLAKLGANSIYTVNMVMKPASTYAETQRISKYNYEIRVARDQYTNGTKLYKATALIHEVIHAYFLSIVDDYNYTQSTVLPTYFPELFEA
jgi:hypothetical protein